MACSSKLAKLSALILFVVGATLLAVGCSVRWVVFPDMLQKTITDNLKLDPSNPTDTYNAFIEPPIPIRMNFNFFHVKNPKEVVLNGSKPELIEVGPYVYEEKRHKEEVTEGGASTLYYKERRTYVFNAEETQKLCHRCKSKENRDLFADPTSTSTTTTSAPTSATPETTIPTTTTEPDCVPCTKEDKVTILSPIWGLVNYALDCNHPELINYNNVSYSCIPRDLDIHLKPPIAPFAIDITWDFLQLILGSFYDTKDGEDRGDQKDGVFLEASVDDILYKGAHSSLTDTIFQLLPPDVIAKLDEMFPQFAGGSFGFFKGKNDTLKDMAFRVNNGDNNLNEFLQIIEFNGETSLKEDWWSNVARTPNQTADGARGICHDIKGTDGTLFAPGVPTEDDKKLWVFVPELCRSIWLEPFNGGDDEIHGIPVQQFRPGPDVFDMSNEDNFCYCPAFEECASKNLADNTYNHTACQAEKYNCVNGLIQVGKCLGGAPISMSSPHFYRADDEMRKAFDGLSEPNPDEHDTILNLDPITGLAVAAHKRIQVNLPLKIVDDFLNTSKAPFVNLAQNYRAFPILWADENAIIDEENADKWKSQVGKAFKLVNGLTYSLGLALGALCVVISWILVLFCVG